MSGPPAESATDCRLTNGGRNDRDAAMISEFHQMCPGPSARCAARMGSWGRIRMVVQGLILFAALASVLGGVNPARAESNALLRFYYSNWISGSAFKSPYDPVGTHAGDAMQPLVKGEAELIVFKRVGVSYARQKVGRTYAENGISVEEYSLQTFTNLTLYLVPSQHNAFNLFAGYGGGQGDFRVYLNRFEQVDYLYENIPLTRRFGGMEYTMERIGFRLELNAIRGEKSEAGRRALVDQRLGYFTVYIPFN